MNTGFKFKVAKSILGVNANIDNNNDVWVSMSQFNKYMGWYGQDAFMRGAISGRKHMPFTYARDDGRITYEVHKSGMWLLNPDGIGHQLSYVQTLVGGELAHIKELFDAVHEWCEDFDAENAISRVKGAMEERLPVGETEDNAVCDSDSQQAALGLRVFEDSRFGQMRTVLRDGEIWFVAADVCRALGLGQVTNALRRLDDDEKMTLNFSKGHSKSEGVLQTMTLNFADPRSASKRGGAQMLNIVNEPGLYQLIIRSNKPEARAFTRWITHDVIPTLRKTGTYSLPNQPRGSLFERMVAGCGARHFSPAQATRLVFGGKESEDEGTYTKQRDFAKAVRKLIPIATLIKSGSTTNYDTWCELYNRSQMIGNFDLFNRKESGLALVDLIRYREWWAVAFAITALCVEAGVDMEQYIDSQIACAFLCVWGYVTGNLTLAQAYQEQGITMGALSA